ncbi:hypothetical protein GQ457_11G025780 [Hibiscus cannabinus]
MSIGTLGIGTSTGKPYWYSLWTLESFNLFWPSNNIGTHKGVPVRYVAYLYSGRVPVQALETGIPLICLRSMGIGTDSIVPIHKSKNALQP